MVLTHKILYNKEDLKAMRVFKFSRMSGLRKIITQTAPLNLGNPKKKEQFCTHGRYVFEPFAICSHMGNRPAYMQITSRLVHLPITITLKFYFRPSLVFLSNLALNDH